MKSLIKKSVGKVVKEAIKEYGTYVIEDRALADFRDGLKPVQRRILWCLWDRLGIRPGSNSKKSARIIGEVLGCFHPHSDVGCYGALVNMTNHSYPLVEGIGNFGDIITDTPAAASRYTAVKAPAILTKMFEDSPVASMVPNYSGEFEEPKFLPTHLPVLLLNGSSGIAVGVSRVSIPPHNLEELVNALKLILKSPNTSLTLLNKRVLAPDYPEGGTIISSAKEIRELYESGKGTIVVQCSFSIKKEGKLFKLVVTSAVAYWDLTKFVERCQSLVADGHINAVFNESAESVKVTVIAKDKEVLKSKVVPLLQKRLSYNWVALAGKTPIKLNLSEYLKRWIIFRREIVEKHLRFKIKKLTQIIEAEEAKLQAIKHLESTIKALRSKKPKKQLAKLLNLNSRQVKVILSSSLRLLTRIGEKKQKDLVKKLKNEMEGLITSIKDVDGVILKELKALIPYFKPRSTKINLPSFPNVGLNP